MRGKRKTSHPEMRDSQAECFFGHKKTDRNEYDSRRGFVVHSDTKRPKVENMERRPVIIKHRTQRRRTSRIARLPARDVWKHELYEAEGRQIIRKCEILKPMRREARKRIYHLGKLKKGHPKSPEVSNGSATTRRAESRASGASLFNVFDPFAQTMGLPES